MIYLNKPYVLVQWDDDLKCAHIEWKGFADGAEYREAHDKIVEALTDHQGHKMLADTCAMKAVAPADQEWVNSDWLPRVWAAGLKYSAVILPKSAVAQMSLQRIVVKAKSGPDPNSGYFDNVEAGKKWLRSMP